MIYRALESYKKIWQLPHLVSSLLKFEVFKKT